MDFSAHSAMSLALQEGLVTDVAADVIQSARTHTAIMSVDVILYLRTQPNYWCQVRDRKLRECETIINLTIC